MKWVPIGRPSSFQHSGTDIAGWPVPLASAVNGEYGSTPLGPSR